MIGPAALLAALALPFPQAAGTSGIEGFTAALRQGAAERRAAAQSAWETHGPTYLKQPTKANLGALAEHAPEIQEPLLEALDAWLASDRSGEELDPLLLALQETMNSAGADRLVARYELLPANARIAAVEGALAAGGRKAVSSAERLLHSPDDGQRQAGLDALVRYGPASGLSRWLGSLSLQHADSEELGFTLAALAQREDLPDPFALPSSLFESPHPDLQYGVLQVLARRPAEEAEDYVVRIAITRSAKESTRVAALGVIEASVEQFRWRSAPRELAKFLDDYQRSDTLAEELAWTLHRIGEKSGARFLLSEHEAAVKANPKDYRARMRLGEVLVDLGQHKDAFREYRAAVLDVEGTPAYSRIKPTQWLYAARAASGARRFSNAAEWLANARMSPRELEPYRDLPEFESALSKPAFKRLFGLD